MNKEFKTAIAPHLFEGQTFCPTLICTLNGWPDVIEANEYRHFPQSKSLDTENVVFVKATDDTLQLMCGGQWQGNYFVNDVYSEKI